MSKQIEKIDIVEKEQTRFEDAHQIIRDVAGMDAPKKKKTKKHGKLTETDIDIFSEEEKELGKTEE